MTAPRVTAPPHPAGSARPRGNQRREGGAGRGRRGGSDAGRAASIPPETPGEFWARSGRIAISQRRGPAGAAPGGLEIPAAPPVHGPAPGGTLRPRLTAQPRGASRAGQGAAVPPPRRFRIRAALRPPLRGAAGSVCRPRSRPSFPLSQRPHPRLTVPEAAGRSSPSSPSIAASGFAAGNRHGARVEGKVRAARGELASSTSLLFAEQGRKKKYISESAVPSYHDFLNQWPLQVPLGGFWVCGRQGKEGDCSARA